MDGEHGALHLLLTRERLPTVERSLTKEFVCRPHRCAATQQVSREAPLAGCPNRTSGRLRSCTGS